MTPDIPGMFERSTASGWVLCFLMLIGLARLWVSTRPKMQEAENARDASLRTDLLARITKLETDLLDERKRCDLELEAMRKQIEGLQRMIVQFQVSSGRVLPLTGDTPAANASIERVAAHLDKIERSQS